MFHRLRAQVLQLADFFHDKPAGPASARPALSGLERRDVMAALVPGSVLNLWYDGVYGDPTPGATVATLGVSQIDPATGAEQTLAKVAVGAAVEAALAEGANGVTASGGAVFFAVSRAGGGFSPGLDDRSSIVRVDPATGKATTLATFGRESRGLTTAADGSLVNVWFDGEYTSNSLYGPASAAVGVSRVDPATGAETVISRAPADAPSPFAPLNDSVSGAAVVGGSVFYATSRKGTRWPGSTTTDDRSSIVRVDLATGKSATLATFGRESRGLAAGADGSLVNAWYDGEYTSTSLYGPATATVGVSRVDPATGAETVLASQPWDAGALGFVSDANAVAVAAGAVVVAESRPGSAGWPPFTAAQEDASSLWTLRGGQPTTWRTSSGSRAAWRSCPPPCRPRRRRRSRRRSPRP